MPRTVARATAAETVLHEWALRAALGPERVRSEWGCDQRCRAVCARCDRWCVQHRFEFDDPAREAPVLEFERVGAAASCGEVGGDQRQDRAKRSTMSALPAVG